MKLVELTEFLVKNVCHYPDSVSVKQFDDDDMITIEVLIKEDDMGVVIGASGQTANAIRTIVQASAYINQEKHVRINFDSF